MYALESTEVILSSLFYQASNEGRNYSLPKLQKSRRFASGVSRPYEFERLVFGDASAPFRAQFVSPKDARINEEQFPIAAETIKESMAIMMMMSQMESRIWKIEELQHCQLPPPLMPLHAVHANQHPLTRLPPFHPYPRTYPPYPRPLTEIPLQPQSTSLLTPDYDVYLPNVLIANVRSLVTKIDELGAVAHVSEADFICITESWFSQSIPDTAMSLSNFILLVLY